MKKLLIIILCFCIIAIMPANATSIGAIDYIDDFDEDGTSIFYIDVSPEEWELTYMNHPFYQNYNPNEKAIFILRYNNFVSPRAICYNCGRSSMSLQEAWGEIKSTPVKCPGDWYSSDIRVAYGWMWRDYCNSCGPLTRWYYDLDERTWSWQINCYYEEPMYGRPYTIYLGKGIEHGYDLHSVYSIYEDGTVHGLNCSCTGTHY